MTPAERDPRRRTTWLRRPAPARHLAWRGLVQSWNGIGKRFTVSCVKVCLKMIARVTFEPTILTLSCDSFTPVARITLARNLDRYASSMMASRNPPATPGPAASTEVRRSTLDDVLLYHLSPW